MVMKQEFSRVLKIGSQYLSVDFMQTSVRENLENGVARSLKFLEKNEKRDCLYSDSY